MTGPGRNPYGGGYGDPRAANNPYAGQAVQTATPAQLVLMLYDGALTAAGKVRHAATQGTAGLALMNKELQRIQAIVSELQVSLNFEEGTPIADYFNALYDFCNNQLMEIAISKDVAKLEGVEHVIAELRDAWNEACVIGNPSMRPAEALAV